MTQPSNKYDIYEQDCDLLTIDVSNTPHPHALIGAGWGSRDCKHHYSHMDLSYIGGAWLENINTSITEGFVDPAGILIPLIDADWADQQIDLRYNAIIGEIPNPTPGDYLNLHLIDSSVPVKVQVQNVEIQPSGKLILELGKRRQDEIDAFNAKSSLSNAFMDQYKTELSVQTTNRTGTLTIGDWVHGWCTPFTASTFTIPASVATFQNYRVTMDLSVRSNKTDPVAPSECLLTFYINSYLNGISQMTHYLLGDTVTGLDVTNLVNYGSASSLVVYCMLLGDWLPAHANCSGHPTADVSATLHAWRRMNP